MPKRLHYFNGNLDNADDFPKLDLFLRSLEDGPANRLYYLATAPEYYAHVAGFLGAAGMAKDDETSGAWRRIIIEKPFGRDLASALELNHSVHAAFEEHQVYRIDHYLGKETAQNILFFPLCQHHLRAGLEPPLRRSTSRSAWPKREDVGHRAGYYDTAGVVRDMFQNHILQLLALVAMEPPSSFSADAIRNEKAKVLAKHPPVVTWLTRSRASIPGYSKAEGVAPGSQTPTYAALKLFDR